MKDYIVRNKLNICSIGLAGAFMSIVTAAALILSEVSPTAIF